MARKSYYETLETVLKEESAQPRPSHITREDCERAIADISAELRGPLGNAERIMLAGDRKRWRTWLAEAAEPVK